MRFPAGPQVGGQAAGRSRTWGQPAQPVSGVKLTWKPCLALTQDFTLVYFLRRTLWEGSGFSPGSLPGSAATHLLTKPKRPHANAVPCGPRAPLSSGEWSRARGEGVEASSLPALALLFHPLPWTPNAPPMQNRFRGVSWTAVIIDSTRPSIPFRVQAEGRARIFFLNLKVKELNSRTLLRDLAHDVPVLQHVPFTAGLARQPLSRVGNSGVFAQAVFLKRCGVTLRSRSLQKPREGGKPRIQRNSWIIGTRAGRVLGGWDLGFCC